MTVQAISLKEAEAREVRAILARHLPSNVRVFVFGSRAGGRVKPWSDLDLLLDGDSRLEFGVLARLAEDFDNSRLPWKVDIVDRAAISPEFGRIVDAGKVPFSMSE
ncbi:MAG: nucleotidyltransferase domain-containing protein [Novosphingobium sp.]